MFHMKRGKMIPGEQGRPDDVHLLVAGDGAQVMITKCPNPRCGGGVVLFIHQPNHQMQNGHFSTRDAERFLDALEGAKAIAVESEDPKAELGGTRIAFDAEKDESFTIWVQRIRARSNGADCIATRLTLLRHYGETMFTATSVFMDHQFADLIAATRVVLFGKPVSA